jgi:hypothetical protein
MKLSISVKAKVALALAAVFLLALLATVFAKTLSLAWIVLKILAVVVPVGAVVYYFKWGKN